MKVTGPFMIFYEDRNGNDITVHLALPVAGPPAELPPPAKYMVLPEIEAVTAVRNGPAASIFPMIYYDLASHNAGGKAAGGRATGCPARSSTLTVS